MVIFMGPWYPRILRESGATVWVAVSRAFSGSRTSPVVTFLQTPSVNGDLWGFGGVDGDYAGLSPKLGLDISTLWRLRIEKHRPKVVVGCVLALHYHLTE